MMDQNISKYAYKKLVWSNILFFGITTLISVIGLPLYAYFVGLTTSDWMIFGFMAVTTMAATTFGYHRLFSHRSYEAHPIVVFLCLFFGAATFGGTALRWSSQHRDHHRFTDTYRDPYNIKQGFWYAHMGWFLNHEHIANYDNVKDLSSQRMIKFQHDHWIWWAILAGIAMPLAVGAYAGSFWGAFFLGVCGRLTFIHQSIFCINSACHYFGKPTYDIKASARDSWICALLTHGEGYHSFHHRFPGDYRNGVRWYHWDPTKWMVKLLSYTGMVYSVNKTAEHRILAARSETEKHFLVQRINSSQHPKIKLALERIAVQYEQVKHHLHIWEQKAFEYRRLQRTKSSELMQRASLQLRRAREEFFNVRKDWLLAIRQNLVLVNQA